ncbi:hypothetical protein ACOMHN_015336 [Nucella lapillus]
MDTGLESLIEEMGSFGRFQILLIIGSYISPILCSWSVMYMVFGIITPDWSCVSRDTFSNQSAHSFLGSNASTSQSSDPFRNGSQGHSTFPNNGVSSTTEVMTGNITNMTDGWDVTKACAAFRAGDRKCESIVFASEMSTVVAEFQLVCDLSWVPSIIVSAKSAGILFGGIIAGQLADSIGRKRTMVVFSILHAALNLICAFSVTWQMFVVLRTLIGITCGAIFVVIFSYPTEFIGPRKRAVVTSLPFWGIGTVSLSLIMWALPHWQYLQLITAACSAASLPVWVFLPESVRWLAVKGHVTKAERVLCKVAKWNGRPAPTFSAVEAMCSHYSKHQKIYNYLHIFSTPQMLKISLVFGTMWFFCSASYYGASYGIKNLSGNFFLNFFLMSIVELPLPLLVFHLTGWFGRRWSLFGCFMICSLTSLAFVPLNLLLAEEAAGNYINILCIVCRGVLVLGWAVMNLFVAEQYPTVVRSIGLGFCNLTARVAGILVPYTLSETEPYICYSIIGVLMFLTALAPLTLAETRGQPLQDEIMTPPNQKGPASLDVTNLREMAIKDKVNQKDPVTIDTSNFGSEMRGLSNAVKA